MLVDTSVLIRTLQPHHSMYAFAARAIRLLPEQGRELHIVPQNLVELWVVATRPIEQNGLGLTAAAAAAELARLKNMFLLLPDTPAIYPAWKALVIRHQVSGNLRTTPSWSQRCMCTASPPFSPSTSRAFPGIPVSRFFDLKK